MSTKLKDFNHLNGSVVEVKSKFDAEFRRFAIRKFSGEKFEDLYQTLQRLHGLQSIPFVIFYTDKDGDLLPINNNENYMKALTSPLTVLRISVQRKDENWSDLIGYSTLNRKKDAKNKILGQMPLSSHSSNKNSKTTPLKIGMPEDFRQVSAIIDVDILPQTLRRVRLLKHGSDRPLGFYIRDGNSVKVTPTGIVRVPGIFISRLVPGGLAESTGLLSVEDEVVEVNGIEVAGKTLDQVTDMMIANSSNLIITVKPANQRLTKSPSDSEALTDAQLSRSSPAMRNTHQRSSQMSASAASTSSFPSNQSYSMEDDDDMDEIRDLTAETKLGQIGNNSGSSGTGSDRPSSSSSTTARRESIKAMRPVSNGLHVTKIIIDGKSNGIIHENEQVFTL